MIKKICILTGFVLCGLAGGIAGRYGGLPAVGAVVVAEAGMCLICSSSKI